MERTVFSVEMGSSSSVLLRGLTGFRDVIDRSFPGHRVVMGLRDRLTVISSHVPRTLGLRRDESNFLFEGSRGDGVVRAELSNFSFDLVKYCHS